MAPLEDLNDDILFLVLQYLELEQFSTLQQLRLASRRLKDFAESQLYKDVTVGDDEDDIDATNRFIERLTNQRDTLSRHVRNITVASFEGEDDSSCLNTELFVRLMEGFQGLATFSWNVDIPMPKAVLDAFHEHRPNTRLYVKTRTFDPALLSSPQLYSLDISVACQNRFSSNTLSLFRRLKDILVQSRKLRMLSLDIHQDPYFRKLALDEADRSSLNLPLEPGDKLPPLEELTIKARDYCFDDDHYYRWLQCMNWKKLRRLSFGLHRPGDSFFFGLVGQTPKLQSLGFGYCGVMVKDWDGRVIPDLHAVGDADSKSTAEFIRSIQSLEELVIRCRSMFLDQPMWRDIAEKHGHSLKRLCIRDWNVYLVNTVSIGSLDLLSSYFPYLQQLDIDLDLVTHSLSLPGSVSPHWNKDQIIALSRLSHLKHLKISVQSNIYTDSVLRPGFEKSVGECAVHSRRSTILDIAIGCLLDRRSRYLQTSENPVLPSNLHEQLWWQFLDNDPTSELISITLRFWRWEEHILEHLDDGSKRAHIKQIFYISSKPNDRRNSFQMKIGKTDEFSVYGVKFQDCDGIS